MHGEWGMWENWTKCTKPCGSGDQYQSRYCNNPAPKNKGNNCSGDWSYYSYKNGMHVQTFRRTQQCNGHKCPGRLDVTT